MINSYPCRANLLYPLVIVAGALFWGTANAFEVTAVKNWSEPGVYRGPCPATIKFMGQIEVDGPGVVRYQWVRSDRATTPVETIKFDRAGVQTVDTEWTFTPVTGVTPWQVIQIIQPNTDATRRLGKAVPKIICEASDRDDYSARARGAKVDPGFRQPAKAVKSDHSRVSSSSTEADSKNLHARLQVHCPTDRITASVIDPLPEGWWTTPQGGTLEKTSVMELADEPALVCEFDANGRRILVTRRYPQGYNRCYARSAERDFVCEK